MAYDEFYLEHASDTYESGCWKGWRWDHSLPIRPVIEPTKAQYIVLIAGGDISNM